MCGPSMSLLELGSQRMGAFYAIPDLGSQYVCEDLRCLC